jgi:hypothetical protein
MFILGYEAGFYKPTVLKVHSPIGVIKVHATMEGRFGTIHYLFCFEPKASW